MEQVADGWYNTQRTASNEGSKTPSSDVQMGLELPGESPASDIALAYEDHAFTGPNNSTAQSTIQASERKVSPFHGVASGKEIAFYRAKERSAGGTGFEDPFSGDDLMLHMAKITLELLQELSTRDAEVHAKTATGRRRRFHRFARKAHRASTWIYRSVQQKGLTIARQQIQNLERRLNGQAEPSPAMAGGARTEWALAQKHLICIRIPSTLALVMRLVPEGVKRSITRRSRADLAKVFVTLVNCWLSLADEEAALTTRGTVRQLASARRSDKIFEAEQIMGKDDSIRDRENMAFGKPVSLYPFQRVAPTPNRS